MSEERDYLYLKGTEELGEVIDALKEISAKEIIIVVPRNTKCFLNATNVSLLASEISKLKKKVYIDSDDERIISLAKSHGLNIFLSEYGIEEATRIVTDILPPQKVKPYIRKVVNQNELSTKKSSPKAKTFLNKILIFTLFLIVILIGYYFLTNNLASANLVITLKTEKHPIDDFLTLSANISEPNLEKGILPAEYIEIEKNHSLRQKTTGI
ncbi:MAG: hypothetical protein NZ866_01085, partial [Patescibacteria group bacterium]|nr:hypothetical protein [Patescibacteria group bacterium]